MPASTPHAAPAPTPSRALLPHLPPTLTVPVYVRHTPFPFPSHRRLLQLRANILLLLPDAEHTSPRDARILPLPTLPTPHGRRDLILPAGQHLHFLSAPARDAFLAAIRDARHHVPHHRDYVPLRRLGSGASGSVYLVRAQRTGAHYALKAIPKPLMRSHIRIAHLIEERLALARAAHHRAACIIRLVDAFETQGHFCFVTQLAAFGDLRAILKQLPHTRLDERLARRMFADILLALEECHRMAFLFRDMKLANLVLDASGHVRLADFGLAKRMRVELQPGYDQPQHHPEEDDDYMHDEEAFRLVGTASSFVGTRRYMSPEQVKTCTSRVVGYGAPADIWALGVCLYVILTGQYPFGRAVSSQGASDLYYAIQYEEIKFPEYLSAEVVDLLKGMLHRDVRRRVDIGGIKSQAWLQDVDWDVVKDEARRSVPQKGLLEHLEKNAVRPIIDEAWEHGSSESSASSSASDPIDAEAKHITDVGDNCRLLGFGYCPQTEMAV